jgi:NADPH-dependent 2,4-dienoyl-CoA reductase/sulfur reductase-like enzyme
LFAAAQETTNWHYEWDLDPPEKLAHIERRQGKKARMTRAPRIAIVGGGVGGLAAALALERRGAEIIV